MSSGQVEMLRLMREYGFKTQLLHLDAVPPPLPIPPAPLLLSVSGYGVVQFRYVLRVLSRLFA